MSDEQTKPLTLRDVSDDEFLAALSALITEGVLTVEIEPAGQDAASVEPGARRDGAWHAHGNWRTEHSADGRRRRGAER